MWSGENIPNSHFWIGKTWENHGKSMIYIYIFGIGDTLYFHTHISDLHQIFLFFECLTGSLGPGLNFCGLIVIFRGIPRLQARDEAHHFLWPKLGILPNRTTLLGFWGTKNRSDRETDYILVSLSPCFFGNICTKQYLGVNETYSL